MSDLLQKVIEPGWEATFKEDLQLVHSMQRGLESRGYRPGPLILDPNGGIESELSIATIHQWLREAVG